tara:strand:- start:187 stop:480 length:294 start_codon:yes stop_codon:yes gene_type:complete
MSCKSRSSFLLRHNSILPRKGVRINGFGIHPLSIHKKRIHHLLGMGSPELLLSQELGTSTLGGYGFGVKTPSKNLINNLENLSLKGSGKKKNIRLIL